MENTHEKIAELQCSIRKVGITAWRDYAMRYRPKLVYGREPSLSTSIADDLFLFASSLLSSLIFYTFSRPYIEQKQPLGQHGDLQHLRWLLQQLAGAKEQLRYRAKTISAEC